MADDIKYCRKCGTPAEKDARFCRKCGYQFPEEQPAVLKGPYCQSCGRENAPGAQFCRFCGKQIGDPGQTKKIAPQTQSRPSAPQLRTLAARTSGGEMDLGEIVFPGMADENVYGPLSGIFRGIGSYFGGILRIFRKPAALAGTVFLAALWFVLALLRNSDSAIVRILSWITFAQGGFDRSIPGMAAGALGKGTVAAALLSLVNGGLADLFKGIGALFAGHGEKRSIPAVLCGILFGVLAYFAFAGIHASADTAMAGIAGAILSLEALGGTDGKLYELAQSLTSRAVNNTRAAVQGKCDGLLTGLTIGFILAAVVSATGITEVLL